LNLLDAFGSFAHVRAIAESFAYRDLLPRIHQVEQQREINQKRIADRLGQLSLNISVDAVLGLERLASARSRLFEGTPQTRRELRHGWLNKVAQPGRVVAIGRSGKRLALVITRSPDGVTALREDGRYTSFPLERVGRVSPPGFSTRPEDAEAALTRSTIVATNMLCGTAFARRAKR
jgi:hypothetical protein